MLEQSLAEDPDDPFLRYGLAMQCLREGDVEEGRQRLRSLIADDPDARSPPTSNWASRTPKPARSRPATAILRTGIAKAQAAGDWHAAAEMEQLLDSLG